MSTLHSTDIRASGPSYLAGVPAAEWVRRLNEVVSVPLRGALANIIDWDYFLHLPVKHRTLSTPSYTQICLWAAPYPAGAHNETELEQGLIQIGYKPHDASARARGERGGVNFKYEVSA